MADREAFVLSVDGGGIRGIIPCVVLIALEKRLQALGKTKPLYRYFHLIGGTSTGGIIAAGLAAPRPGFPDQPALAPDRLLELYERQGERIFSRDRRQRIREAVKDARMLIGPAYDPANLKAELIRYLGSETTTRAALTHVMLTAYDIALRKTLFITNTAAEDDEYRFWEAAMATSAAPTYFPPAFVENLTRQRKEALIDGGVFANDPAQCAYNEAQKLGHDAQAITVVSLGTGYQNRPYYYIDAKTWGPLNWINPGLGNPLISIFMDGQADATGYHLDRLLNPPAGPRRYYRIDGELVGANEDMDDASPKNTAALRRLGERIAADHAADLDAIAGRLQEIDVRP